MEKTDINQVALLLEQEEEKVGAFGRNTYADAFAAFMEENNDIWTELRRLFLEEDRQEETEKALAQALVQKAQEIMSLQTKRTNREKKQLDLNLFMVAYLLPAILECRESTRKDSHACQMAETICLCWREAFPKHAIQYAEFASIQGGFRQKLCYITTAVCRGLHKPENCRELQLLKAYRDEYLQQQEDGEAVIKAYYDIAPTIVKRIAKEAAPEEKYQYLWEHYLRFCVALLENGKLQECREKYEEMVEELRRQYMVTNHKEEI